MSRILIADDEPAIRGHVRAMLERRPELEVCGEAGEGREAVSKALLLKPDLVILDITLGELGGLTAGHMIKQASPATRILILSIHEEKQWIQTAILIGASGYVTKSDAGRTLLDAVDTVLRDQIFFPALS